MSNKTLKVGVVGLGRIGRVHALNLLHRTPGATLLCVCSPAESDLRWAGENLIPHCVRILQDFETMINVPDLEAIVVASPTAMHLDHTVAALDKGIHVLCEKPVCTSVAELNKLIERLETSPKEKLMIGFARRFDQSNQDAHEKIQAGFIGQPLVFRSQSCTKLDMSPFKIQYLQSSGGIFLDSTIHDIDLCLYCLGEHIQPKSVYAAGLNAVYKDLEEHRDVDNAVGICEFWDGKLAFFYSSRIAAYGFDNAAEIMGTEGKLSVNLTSRHSRVEVHQSDGYIKTSALPDWYDRYSEAFVREIQSWTDAIHGEKPMPISMRSVCTSLTIASALQESLVSGRKIEFTAGGVPVDSRQE